MNRNESAAPPVVIVLASGKGRRFVASGGSGSKLDAALGDSTVLAYTLAAVAASGLLLHVERADHAGMADSIAAAVRATAAASGWLILPGDLPLIRADSLSCVAAALMAGDAIDAVAPRHLGAQGHPVAFAASVGPALRALSGEGGAAPVLRACRVAGRCLELDLDDAGITLDIDELADLERAERLLKSRRS